MSPLLDLRIGARLLFKHRAFTFAALVCLVLGIGATTTMFSVAYGVLFRPLLFAEPQELVMVSEIDPAHPNEIQQVTAGLFESWRDGAESFRGLIAYTGLTATVTGEGNPREEILIRASIDYFDTLGIPIVQGRGFVQGEDDPGRGQVLVLSHRAWERQFGADPDIVGRRITLDDEPFTVVGVAEPPFGEEAIGWSPLVIEQDRYYWDRHNLLVVGRLKPGVSIEQARSDLEAIAAAMHKSRGGPQDPPQPQVTPLREFHVGSFREPLLVLAVSVLFVLLIACVNVANLMLVRSLGRNREMAIRTALGSDFRRLTRQLLTESVMLSVVAGAISVLLAYWGLEVIKTLGASAIPRIEYVTLDYRTLLVALGLSVVCGLLFGIAPVTQAARLRVPDALKEGGSRSVGGGGGRNRTGNLFVTLEIASAVVLLIAAVLLVRSFVSLSRVDPGFHSDDVVSVSLALTDTRYPEAPEQTRFARRLVERVQALPSVRSAGVTTAVPLGPGPDFDLPFVIPGQPDTSVGERPQAQFRIVTPGYFETLRIELIDGRTFRWDDLKEGRSAMVISQSLARRFWPDRSPVGERLVLELLGDRIEHEVVGVVGDVRSLSLERQPRMEMFVVRRLLPLTAMNLVVRTETEPLSIAQTILNEISHLDPDQPVRQIVPMKAHLAESVSTQRFALSLMGTIAVVALLLAAAGIYGVVSHSVSQRTREISLRMAVGADDKTVLGLIMKQSFRLAVVGTGLGLLIALPASSVVGSLLYGVESHDVFTYVIVPALILPVAIFATLLPAWRASRVQPGIALRSE